MVTKRKADPAPALATTGLPEQVDYMVTSEGHRAILFTQGTNRGMHIDLTVIRSGESGAVGFLFSINEAKLLAAQLHQAIQAAGG